MKGGALSVSQVDSGLCAMEWRWGGGDRRVCVGCFFHQQLRQVRCGCVGLCFGGRLHPQTDMHVLLDVIMHHPQTLQPPPCEAWVCEHPQQQQRHANCVGAMLLLLLLLLLLCVHVLLMLKVKMMRTTARCLEVW